MQINVSPFQVTFNFMPMLANKYINVNQCHTGVPDKVGGIPDLIGLAVG